MASSKSATASGYLPGSVVRVKLTNFVTFDSVEFFPGPSLNLVIGPNGSGKSTLVAAMCLGLGGKATVLNDQKKLFNYVKTNCTKAVVEIEIQSKDNSPNPVIIREFGVEDNSSKWTLNGQNVAERKITDLVASYNIQVGNLCQFLPQDRVYDFCKLKPEDILKETEKAAGDANMFAEHEELIKFGSEESVKAEQLSNEKGELETLVRRNDAIKPEVERFRQREVNAHKLRLCNLKKPWLEYDNARNHYLQVKEQRVVLKKEKEAYEKDNEPLIKQIDSMKRERTGLDQKKKDIGEKIKVASKAVDDFTVKIEAHESSIDDMRKELDHILENREKKLKMLKGHEQTIAELQQKIAGFVEPDTTEINAKIQSLTDQLREFTYQIDQIQEAAKDLHQKTEPINRELQIKHKQISEISDPAAQRLMNLRNSPYQNNKDLYEAVMWLRKNPVKTRGIVHEPLMLTINLTDKHYAAEIEAAIPYNVQQAFLVENNEDQALLHEALQSRNFPHTIFTIPRDNPEYTPSDSDIRKVKREGFDDFAINFVVASNSIKNLLCDRAFLHTTPIGKRDVDLRELNYRAFFANGKEYHSNTSSYGNRAKIVSQKPINNATMLNNSIDVGRRDQLTKEIGALEEKLLSINAQREELDKKDEAIRRKDRPLREEKNLLGKQKAELTAKRQEHEKLKMNLESETNRMKRLEAEIRKLDVAQQQQDIQDKIQAKIRDRAHLALKAANMHVQVLAAIKDRAIVILSIMAKDAELLQLNQNFQQVQQRIEIMRNDLEKAIAEEERAKNAAKDALTRANDMGQPSAEDTPEFEKLPNDIDVLDAIIADLEAIMRVHATTTGSVIKEFEDREKVIEKLSLRVREKENELNGMRENVQRLKTDWAPRVEALVAKISEGFSAFMAKLNNVGEVKLVQDPDYNKWRVAILVKFRPSEPLIELNNHHHSGGERTVSTILYLMGLQDTARSPFRLVDEINQGMDKNNERRVYKEIVNTATQANTSQYFLITPKLLTNLDYNDKMKVHCVYNSPYQPSHDDWSVDKFIAAAASQRGVVF